MSDDVVDVVESKATAEQQELAKGMGWKGPDEFTGDPERFVDADEYIRRGQEVMPILRQRNKELQDQVSSMNTALADMKQTVAKLEISHSAEAARKVEEARANLVAQLKDAIENNDAEAQAKILGGLAIADKAQEKQEAWDKKTDRRTQPKPNEHFLAWAAKNPWFGKTDRDNRKKSYEALAIADDVREDMPELIGSAAFHDEVDKRLAKLYRTAPTDSKVGESRGGSSGGGTINGYSDMPAEARKQCDADAKQYVGEGKAFKDKKSFQEFWVGQYVRATTPGAMRT